MWRGKKISGAKAFSIIFQRTLYDVTKKKVPSYALIWTWIKGRPLKKKKQTGWNFRQKNYTYFEI